MQCVVFFFCCFFFKQIMAYEFGVRLVGSVMCLCDSPHVERAADAGGARRRERHPHRTVFAPLSNTQQTLPTICSVLFFFFVVFFLSRLWHTSLVSVSWAL